MMRMITKILDVICKVAKGVCALCLAAMLVVSLLEIVRRYIFGQSFIWADELIRYCIVAVAAIGGSSAYRDAGGLVSFDLLQSRLHGKAKLCLEVIINTVVAGFSAYTLMNAVETFLAPSIRNQISVGLGISMMWAYLPIVIGLALLFILSLEKYYRIFAGYKNGEYSRTAEPALEGGEKA